MRTSKDELEKMITFDNKIGGLKYETNKYIIDTKIQMKENEPVTFNKPKINIITVDDEYNVDVIKKKVDGLNNLLILGKYAGVGKTTLAVKLGTKILIISPYNALCQEHNKNGFDDITYDTLFGHVVKFKEVPNFNRVDISEYDLIVFDEIMLYNVKQLMNIMYFIDLNPNKRIIATGDSDQNTPFMNILNQYEYTLKQYLCNCVCMMLPNQLTLCINKRLKKEEEKVL